MQQEYDNEQQDNKDEAMQVNDAHSSEEIEDQPNQPEELTEEKTGEKPKEAVEQSEQPPLAAEEKQPQIVSDLVEKTPELPTETIEKTTELPTSELIQVKEPALARLSIKFRSVSFCAVILISSIPKELVIVCIIISQNSF